jgi:hypothetical protein
MDLRQRLPRLDTTLFVRNSDLGTLQETFLLTGVTTVLVIRTQLWLTNYPQLGGHGLHIAHLLWGGLFMTVAISLAITFLGRRIRVPVAVIGGVGFGFFIDELGKFITSDNNYFYKPAAALIYLIFLGLFMAARAMRRRRGFSPRECLSNAIDLLGEAARHDLDERERARALLMLGGADPHDPLTGPLRALLEQADAMPTRPPRGVARWLRRLRGAYADLVCRPRFKSVVSWVFGVWALLTVLTVFELVLTLGLKLGGAHTGFGRDQLDHLAFENIASLASSLVSAGFVARGIVALHREGRLAAYAWFERAVLVAIFVTQVFSFVESQFGAVFGLGIDVLLLVTLRYVTESERHLGPGGGEAAPQRPGYQDVMNLA